MKEEAYKILFLEDEPYYPFLFSEYKYYYVYVVKNSLVRLVNGNLIFPNKIGTFSCQSIGIRTV